MDIQDAAVTGMRGASEPYATLLARMALQRLPQPGVSPKPGRPVRPVTVMAMRPDIPASPCRTGRARDYTSFPISDQPSFDLHAAMQSCVIHIPEDHLEPVKFSSPPIETVVAVVSGLSTQQFSKAS
jgi:hypothetical protein